jgi:hypothetical protein
MLLLAGAQAVVGAFVLGVGPGLGAATAGGVASALLFANAALGAFAVLRASERAALAHAWTCGALALGLLAEVAAVHPASCAPAETVDDTPIGQLLTHLLWTADACMLMSILGWVSAGSAGALGAYLWWMTVCHWVLLRAKSEDARRVRRAIAALPCRAYRKAAAADDDVEAATDDDERCTCAICLCDFEEGEEVRLLPCMHEFCRECIDAWIGRQGIAASCPLCKRMLVPRAPGRNAVADDADAPVPDAPADADAAAAPHGAAVRAEPMLEPLIVPARTCSVSGVATEGAPSSSATGAAAGALSHGAGSGAAGGGAEAAAELEPCASSADEESHASDASSEPDEAHDESDECR